MEEDLKHNNEETPVAPEIKKDQEEKNDEKLEISSAEPISSDENKEENVENSNRKWYIIQTLTGYEEKVKRSIEYTIETENLGEVVSEVLIPEEEVIEIKDGRRIEKVKKMYPGYVFIEMVLAEDTWYAIRSIPGVARFIGSKVQPIPVSDREMQRVLKQMGVQEEKIEVAFDVGESVRIISGPFRGYTGRIEDINLTKEKMKVMINIFGRETPVEINFDQAEKIV